MLFKQNREKNELLWQKPHPLPCCLTSHRSPSGPLYTPRAFTAMSELRTYLKNLDGSHKYVVEERDQTQKGACMCVILFLSGSKMGITKQWGYH